MNTGYNSSVVKPFPTISLVKNQQYLFGLLLHIFLNGTVWEWPWLGAPEYGEARAERNSVFARIWRNAIERRILSRMVLFHYQTVFCVILDDLT